MSKYTFKLINPKGGAKNISTPVDEKRLAVT
jgi:hypothetical protein